MTDSITTIPTPPTDLWHSLQAQPKSPISNLIRAKAIAAMLRRSLCDETPIEHGRDGHYLEVCVRMLEKQLDQMFGRLEESLSGVNAAA